MYLRASYFWRKTILATILTVVNFKKRFRGDRFFYLYILQAQNEIVFYLSRPG